MLVKFFRHGTNTKGSIEYLLNDREEKGTATTIKGNPTLTKEIIKNIKQKNRYKSGCLSFEEKNISNEIKQELINSFENMLLAGLDKEQYNILWVEHIDKGRLELNFVIPRVSKDYLSIKLPNQKAKRFKGAIYDGDFKELRDIETSLTKRSEELRKYDTRDTQTISSQLKQTVTNLISKKAIYNKRRYPKGDAGVKPSIKNSNKNQQSKVSNNSTILNSRIHSSSNNGELNSNTILPEQKLDSSTKSKSNYKQSKFYEDIPISNIYTKKHQIQIYQNRKIIYDTIRKSIISRATELTKSKQQSTQYFKDTRAEILRTVTQHHQRIHQTTKYPSSNYIQHLTNKFRESFSRFADTIKHITKSIQNIGRESFYMKDIEDELQMK